MSALATATGDRGRYRRRRLVDGLPATSRDAGRAGRRAARRPSPPRAAPGHRRGARAVAVARCVDGCRSCIAKHDGQRVVVLASGDPLVSGIGDDAGRPARDRSVSTSTGAVVGRAGAGPAGLVGRDHRRRDAGRPRPRHGAPALRAGRRLRGAVLRRAARPTSVAALLVGPATAPARSRCSPTSGSPDESRVDATAATWRTADVTGPATCSRVDVVADPETRALSLVPGLPDEAFEHDGQLTKRDLRACPGPAGAAARRAALGRRRRGRLGRHRVAAHRHHGAAPSPSSGGRPGRADRPQRRAAGRAGSARA